MHTSRKTAAPPRDAHQQHRPEAKVGVLRISRPRHDRMRGSSINGSEKDAHLPQVSRVAA